MKIGKQPKRTGPPSDAFLARTRPELLTPPAEGPVNIYLDDSRPVPEGWTVARSSAAFFDFLNDPAIAERITYLSIDGFLARGDRSGILLAEKLCERFQGQPNFLPSLKSIGFHNKNRSQSARMDQMFAASIPQHRLNSFYVIWGTPRLPEQPAA